MTDKTRCAACGKARSSASKSISEDGNVFCDQICRANYRKGIRFLAPTPAVPEKKPLTEKQKKFVGRLVEGVFSIILGLVLTWWSKNHDALKGYYVLFFGPVLWGIIAIIWGAFGLWKSKQQQSPLQKYMK